MKRAAGANAWPAISAYGILRIQWAYRQRVGSTSRATQKVEICELNQGTKTLILRGTLRSVAQVLARHTSASRDSILTMRQSKAILLL